MYVCKCEHIRYMFVTAVITQLSSFQRNMFHRSGYEELWSCLTCRQTNIPWLFLWAVLQELKMSELLAAAWQKQWIPRFYGLVLRILHTSLQLMSPSKETGHHCLCHENDLTWAPFWKCVSLFFCCSLVPMKSTCSHNSIGVFALRPALRTIWTRLGRKWLQTAVTPDNMSWQKGQMNWLCRSSCHPQPQPQNLRSICSVFSIFPLFGIDLGWKRFAPVWGQTGEGA